jgi:hypothetical protein
MEAIRSSETSGTTLRTTRRHIPEDNILQNYRCENLKSYNKNMVPDGARNQERLCWRGPAAIYWTGLSNCSYFLTSQHFTFSTALIYQMGTPQSRKCLVYIDFPVKCIVSQRLTDFPCGSSKNNYCYVSFIGVLATALGSVRLATYVPLLMSETKLHTHTKLQAKLWFCIPLSKGTAWM